MTPDCFYCNISLTLKYEVKYMSSYRCKQCYSDYTFEGDNIVFLMIFSKCKGGYFGMEFDPSGSMIYKSSDNNAFSTIVKFKPHEIPAICPSNFEQKLKSILLFL